MKFTYNNKEYELILFVLAGSRLYGTSTEKSDWDYRGIFIAPPEDKLGILGSIEQINSKELYSILKDKIPGGIQESDDISLFEIKKFVKLATDNNPNILDILFADEESILYSNEKGKELLYYKDLFISTKAKFSFSGYAYSQLKRIKGHKKWINEYPHTNKVIERLSKAYVCDLIIDLEWIQDYFGGDVASYFRKKYGVWTAKSSLTLYKPGNIIGSIPDWKTYVRPHIVDFITLRKSDFTKIKNWTTDGRITFDLFNQSEYKKENDSTYLIYVNPEFKGVFDRPGNFKNNPISIELIDDFSPKYIINVDINGYKTAVSKWVSLWNWKMNRNVERGTLEDDLGYDGKHASHLIRLMIGAEQILSTGNFNPRLAEENLDLVKDIRNGKYPYHTLIKFSEDYEEILNKLYETTDLQKEPQRKKINRLLIQLSM